MNDALQSQRFGGFSFRGPSFHNILHSVANAVAWHLLELSMILLPGQDQL